MKRLFILCLFFIGIACSSVKVVHDKFDNSSQYKLEFRPETSREYFARVDGKLKIAKIQFLKDQSSAPYSEISVLFRFEGYLGEMFDGDTIELNTDGIIQKIVLDEARLGQSEIYSGGSATIFTRIGAFTFSDATRSNTNIIAINFTLPKETQEAILGSKALMVRLYTKNIDGVSKNTFRFRSMPLRNLKKLIRLSQY